MAVFAPESIEARCKGAFHPVHALGEICISRFDRQMEVIAHQNIGMDDPPESLGGFVQAFLESLPHAARHKNRMPIVPPVNYVVKGVGELQSQWASHLPENGDFRLNISSECSRSYDF